jgi:tetratricopeptide (TPR) repeat protein
MVEARVAQWEKSEKSFRRAIELDPNSSLVRVEFVGNLLMPLNRLDEALAQMRLAAQNDPLSSEIQSRLTQSLFIAGRFDEAVARCPKPCVTALIIQRRGSEAIPVLEKHSSEDLADPELAQLGVAYALAGRWQDAERIASGQWRPLGQAKIFAALGDKDRAFQALERAIPLGPVRVGRDLTFPEFASLRGDPRLKALRKKVGLPQ